MAPLKFEMAPLNLKRAINFYKFRKKKSFICRLPNLIGGSPRKPAGGKKKSVRGSLFFLGRSLGRPILFLDRPIGNMAK